VTRKYDDEDVGKFPKNRREMFFESSPIWSNSRRTYLNRKAQPLREKGEGAYIKMPGARKKARLAI
jgi:hypothetical protein